MPFGLDLLGVDVVDVHARARVDAGVDERLRQALVGVLQVDVLADHGDVDLVVGMLERVHDPLPHR